MTIETILTLISLVGDIQAVMTNAPKPLPVTLPVQSILADHHWMVDHFPGGDPSLFPQGIFEVYPEGERRFDAPLGQGPTVLDAVAIALKGDTRE